MNYTSSLFHHDSDMTFNMSTDMIKNHINDHISERQDFFKKIYSGELVQSPEGAADTLKCRHFVFACVFFLSSLGTP